MAKLMVVAYRKGAEPPSLRFKYSAGADTQVKITPFGVELLDLIVQEKPSRLIFSEGFQDFMKELKLLVPQLPEESTFEDVETMFITPLGAGLDLMLTDLEMVREHVNGVLARQREQAAALAQGLEIDMEGADDDECVRARSYPGAAASPVFARLASFAGLGADHEYVRAVADYLAARDKPFQLRNQIIKGFNEFYHAVACKLDQGLPPEARAMLRWRAVLDEAWLGVETRGFLLAQMNAPQQSRDIFFADEWLEMIRTGQVAPTYDDMIIHEIRTAYRNRSIKKPINTEDIYREEVINKVGPDGMFKKEVDEVFSNMVKLVIGRRGDHFPFLNEDMIPGEAARAFASKEDVRREVDEVLKLDPTIFVKRYFKDAKTVIENDIPPYIIIVPAKGRFGVAWDVSHRANRRRSRGRVAVPQLPTRDMKTAAMAALGHYRWEAGRDAAFDWTAEGLTGAYYDYFLTERKKPVDETSVNKQMNERDNFVLEYVNWLTYESRGVQKLKPRVREIMWRYVPFPDELKRRLGAEFPQLYGELLRRDDNRAKSRGG